MNQNRDSLSILHNAISTDDCSSSHPDRVETKTDFSYAFVVIYKPNFSYGILL